MNLQNMAPNAKRSLLITLVFGTIAAGLYFAAIEPAETKLNQTKSALADAGNRHELMMRNLRNAENVKKRLSTVEAALKPFQDALLVPFLESYAMRAKTLVDAFAQGAGLNEVEYGELTPIALPVPKRLPEQLYARRPVRILCRGSYQAAVSFLLRLEKEMPLVALQSLTIDSQNDQNQQRIEFILEWPAKGAVTKK